MQVNSLSLYGIKAVLELKYMLRDFVWSDPIVIIFSTLILSLINFSFF